VPHMWFLHVGPGFCFLRRAGLPYVSNGFPGGIYRVSRSLKAPPLACAAEPKVVIPRSPAKARCLLVHGGTMRNLLSVFVVRGSNVEHGNRNASESPSALGKEAP
jgi:hypothetical protein